MTVIVTTLRRGGGGTAPFPTTTQDDARLHHVSVPDLPGRDNIPEWKRLSRMTCFVISENTTYRLGTDTTISGQVWTSEATGTNVQTRDEKNQPDGYVGLNSEGFVDPVYIRSIYAQDYYTPADEAERFALTAKTGDIAHQLDTNEIYIKKNNNAPPTTATDWADITASAAVISVNGQTGAVQIDLDTLLGFGSSASQFETAVSNSTAVSQLAGQIASNDSDIADLYSIVNGLVADDSNIIPLWDNAKGDYKVGNNVIYDAGGANKNLYRCTVVPAAGIPPTDTNYWERIGDFYTQAEITSFLNNKADLVNGKVPISQLPSDYQPEVTVEVRQYLTVTDANATDAFNIGPNVSIIIVKLDAALTQDWAPSALTSVVEDRTYTWIIIKESDNGVDMSNTTGAYFDYDIDPFDALTNYITTTQKKFVVNSIGFKSAVTLSGASGTYNAGDEVQGVTSGAKAVVTIVEDPGATPTLRFYYISPWTTFDGSEGINNNSDTGISTGSAPVVHAMQFASAIITDSRYAD